MQTIFVDTNVILNPKFKLEDYEKVYISIASIEEIDNLKHKNDIGYLAREAMRKLIKAPYVIVLVSNNASTFIIRSKLNCSDHKNDNIILSTFKDVYDMNKECIFITDDYALYFKANALKLPCKMFEYEEEENNYTGWKIVDLDNYELAKLYENMNENIYGLHTNEYLIIKLNGEYKDKLRWDGEKLVNLKSFRLRRKKDTEVLKPLDYIQECAYDAILNPDIEVVCLVGKSGTGKTKTALSLSLELLKTEEFTKIVFVRHALEAGSSIGYLPGNLIDKMEPYTKCLSDNLNSSMNTLEDYIESKKIEVTSLSLLKGRNFDNNTIVIFDEAEDAYPEHIEIVGTRQCDKSKTIFCGDYNQVSNSKYAYNSGIQKLIQKAKGKDWFACVELQTNGRGRIAEFFADEFKNVK